MEFLQKALRLKFLLGVCVLLTIFSSQSLYANTTDNSNNQPYPDMRLYIFGHSLLVHQPTPSNEATVPHWMNLFADHVGSNFTVNGQFGFLMQHSNLPPISQWGFRGVDSSWDPDENLSAPARAQSFASADFTDFLLTAANFIQYQGPDSPYEGDNPGNKTPLDYTLQIIDWLEKYEPGANIYIYENWPEMAAFGDFPVNRKQFDKYNDYVLGDFHQWWVSYYEALREARPSATIKMVPVGPIITGLLTETPLKAIPIEELYEDSAPHGRPNIYFLASLITHMAMNDRKALSDFEPPMTIHQLIRDDMSTVVNYIWDKLEQYNASLK